MTGRAPRFRLVPLSDLLEHEEINPRLAEELREEIARSGKLSDPIWVAEDSGVILNGHHRVTALRSLGAERAPAWVLDYASAAVELGRWTEGPPISKDEVVRRARAHELFPPKTTRHRIGLELPSKVTPLSALMPQGTAARSPRGRQRRASGRSRSRGAAAGGSA
jgi:hypothetical protein